MSRTSEAVLPDFDFWNTVHCAKCHLPFATDHNATPLIPFWLTDCGHVICNSHLNADQSCTRCGTQSVQMVPLQREMDPPMSDWFRSLPHAIDSIAQTAKFQQESMASLLTFYKDRCQRQRVLIERMKVEVVEAKSLRIALEELRVENEQLRQYVDYGPQSEPGSTQNKNGKRRMTDMHRGPRTNSSPVSITTPFKPNRLTLPPDHQEPNLRSVRPENTSVEHETSTSRPSSSRFTQQNAYTQTLQPHFHQQDVFSHEQSQPAHQSSNTNQLTDGPYPRRSGGEPSAARKNLVFNPTAPIKRSDQNRRIMGPPPTPQNSRSQMPAAPTPRRFAPPVFSSAQVSASARVPRQVPSTPLSASQRFGLPPSGSVRRASNTSNGGGYQRVPFVVGAQSGFI